MKILDLFCGAGGASMGYSQAGHTLVGVDHVRQPHYPFDFAQADALKLPMEFYRSFDLIHASPPCQAYSVASAMSTTVYPELVEPTRGLLNEIGVPWVIENVPGAPIRLDLTLCGSHFDLNCAAGYLLRHRHFEFSDRVVPPRCPGPCNHSNQPVISIFGKGGYPYNSADVWREVMRTPWMNQREIAQAIPPAYTKYIIENLAWA